MQPTLACVAALQCALGMNVPSGGALQVPPVPGPPASGLRYFSTSLLRTHLSAASICDLGEGSLCWLVCVFCSVGARRLRPRSGPGAETMLCSSSLRWVPTSASVVSFTVLLRSSGAFCSVSLGVCLASKSSFSWKAWPILLQLMDLRLLLRSAP